MWVTSVRMRREDRSSISSHPLADLGGKLSDYLIACFLTCAVPLFVPCSRSFVPADARPSAARKGASRLAVALCLPITSALPGHALTGPRTELKSVGALSHSCTDALEVALLVENGPGDAGKFVGERDRQHVVVQSLLGASIQGLSP